MNINFSQMFNPGHETLYVDGFPFILGRSYNNVVVEDEHAKVTFQEDGIAHIELKRWNDMTPREAYVNGNGFIGMAFKQGVQVSKDEREDGVVYFGYLEANCDVKKNGKRYKRTISIDNGFCVFNDGTEEHYGIDISVTEKEVMGIPKK